MQDQFRPGPAPPQLQRKRIVAFEPREVDSVRLELLAELRRAGGRLVIPSITVWAQEQCWPIKQAVAMLRRWDALAVTVVGDRADVSLRPPPPSSPPPSAPRKTGTKSEPVSRGAPSSAPPIEPDQKASPRSLGWPGSRPEAPPASPPPDIAAASASPQNVDAGAYDHDAASEALDGWFDPQHEKQLQTQERELRLLHRMMGLTITFDAWIARCRVDLGHLYTAERQDLGTLIGCTPQQYAQFATDPMGRKRSRRPDARFPSSFIPGCFTEAEAKQFRKEINQPKRREAEKRRRSKISKAKAAANAALEKEAGLDPMQKALVRALDRWMTPLDAARALRRSLGWKTMKRQSRKRRINEMAPGLVGSGYIEIKAGTPRQYRRRRR